MRLSFLGMNGRGLLRLSAMLAAGTFLAGCSSGVARFSDDIYTSAIPSRQEVAATAHHQSAPGYGPIPAASIDGSYTGSVNRAAVTPVTAASAPVQRSALPPVSTMPPVSGGQGPVTASLDPALAPVVPDQPVTVRTARAPLSTAPVLTPRRQDAAAPTTARDVDPQGWTSAGGTQITVREGETVYNLSRRFGVPAAAIVRANALPSADALAAGQTIVIPTYVYSGGVKVSAPDANPNVAEAKSSRGTRFDVPLDKVPLPSFAPGERVAILPQSPRVKEKTAAVEATASSGTDRSVGGRSNGAVYTVVEGDTLYGIAAKTGVNATEIKAANRLSDGFLRIGQKLVIPSSGGAVSQARAEPEADRGSIIARGSEAEKTSVASYQPPRRADTVIEEAEETSSAVAPDSTGIGRMRWPVRGRIVAGYGASGGAKANDGIDIAVPEGTPVKAAENGVVIYAGNGLKEFGNTVLIRHEDGLVTVYGHASELRVSRGDKVRRGQEIARSGMSGAAESPRLHFEVRQDSAPVDPAKFLE